LQGFKWEEAQPLGKGLETVISNYQAVIKEILTWTSGQPFLTQKLCYLVVIAARESHSGVLKIPPGSEGFFVESVVRSHIIHKWESQDEPEHLRTIRDRLCRCPLGNRILHNEQRAGRLLGIYQQILRGVEVPTDDSREQVELLLSGLVVKQQGVLKVRNPIYQEVFNLEWVEKQLGQLRPYSQATAILWNLERIFQLDFLQYGCNWVRDYLGTNADVEESDSLRDSWTSSRFTHSM
jgi:hypothetical protein